jgi:hypothetical protein
MGGEGSGRRPDPIKNLMGFNQPMGESATLYLPNTSGIKQGAVKQTDVPIPLLDGDIANKSYVDSQISGENHWDDDGTYLHPYFPTRGLYISGAVGIGTTSPAEKLDIAGDIRISNINPALFFVTPTAYNWRVAGQQSVDRGFEITPSTIAGGTTFTNPAFVIKADSGNVGIGTTSPGAKLDVKVVHDNVALKLTSSGISAVGQTVGDISFYDSDNANEDARISAVVENSYGSGLAFSTKLGDASAGFATERMRILGNGNVGIGTSSPDQKLHIGSNSGDVKLALEWSDGNAATTGKAYSSIYTSGQGASYPFSGRGNLILQPRNIDSNGYGDLVVMTGATATPKFVVQAGGNVGIGTTSPTAKAHINQSSTTAAIPVLTLDQADISEEMIEFVTTIGTGNAIEAVAAKTLTTTHFIKVTLPGNLTRYIPCGTIA